jgi:hypothetical protein
MYGNAGTLMADGWRYQAVIDAIRSGRGWCEIPPALDASTDGTNVLGHGASSQPRQLGE